MKKIILPLLVALLAASIFGCARNQPGGIVLGDGKIGQFELCPVAQNLYAIAVLYGQTTGDPRAQAALAAAPAVLGLLGCDPSQTEIQLTPEQCNQIVAVITAYRASGKSNPAVDRWIALLAPKLCPGTVIATPIPTPVPTPVNTPVH